MPIDVSIPKFLCEICRDDFKSYADAERCEQQGIEADPLPDGTPILTMGHRRTGPSSSDPVFPVVDLVCICGHQVGSGKYNQGAGHNVEYTLSAVGDEKTGRSKVRPREIYPHTPGQVNTTIRGQQIYDGRTVGDRLQRLSGWHQGRHPEQIQAIDVLSTLLGRPVDPDIFRLAFEHSTMNPRSFKLLAPRGHLDAEVRDLIDAVCRPLTRADFSDLVRWPHLRFYATALDREGNGEFKAPFPERGAYSLLCEQARFNQAGAIARLLASTPSELIQGALDRSDAWWAGEDVRLPAELLCPAEGVKTGALSRTQRQALEALGRPVAEIPHQLLHGQWAKGLPEDLAEDALLLVSDAPARSNAKPRYSPRSAVAALIHSNLNITEVPMETHADGAPPIPVICVAAGKGGVGKSTVAASLAIALTAAGKQATVVDCDLQGPSLPSLLNLPAAQAAGKQLIPHRLDGGAGAFSLGQIFDRDLHLSFDEAATEALVRFMAGGLDLTGDEVLVVDLPPGTPQVQHIINRLWKPRTLLVTTGSQVAHADLRRAMTVARETVGIVENLTRATATTAAGELVEVRLYDGADTNALAAELDAPYLGSLPHQPTPHGLAATPELRQVAERVIAALDTAEVA